MAGPFTVEANLAAGSPASPTSGLWWNAVADGTGISFTRSSTGNRILVWLTYTPNGKPIWYMSRPAVERDGVLSAVLERIDWKASSASLKRRVVGRVSYAALKNGRMLFDWELDDGNNESAGSEILTRTIGGTVPTGLWNEPGAANGRGFVMHSEIINGSKRNFVTTLTYSGEGKPRWQFGAVDGQMLYPTTIDIQENRRSVSCSTCQPVQYRLEARAVGQLNVEFYGAASGWVNIVTRDNGEWIRGSPANPISYGQITTR